MKLQIGRGSFLHQNNDDHLEHPLERLTEDDHIFLTPSQIVGPSFHMDGVDVTDPKFPNLLIQRMDRTLRSSQHRAKKANISGKTLYDSALNTLVWSLDYMESLEGLPWTPFGEKIVDKMRDVNIPICLEHIAVLSDSYPLEFGSRNQRIVLRCTLDVAARYRLKQFAIRMPFFLVELDLAFCRLDDDLIRPLTLMKFLKFLNLSFTDVSDDGIISCLRPLSVNQSAGLSTLNCLMLQGCRNLTDRILPHLKYLTHLARLILSQTSTTQKEIRRTLVVKQGFKLQDHYTPDLDSTIEKMMAPSELSMLEHWLLGIRYGTKLGSIHSRTNYYRNSVFSDQKLQEIICSYNLYANVRILTRCAGDNPRREMTLMQMSSNTVPNLKRTLTESHENNSNPLILKKKSIMRSQIINVHKNSSSAAQTHKMKSISIERESSIRIIPRGLFALKPPGQGGKAGKKQ